MSDQTEPTPPEIAVPPMYPASIMPRPDAITTEEIERRFTYHSPKGDQPARCVQLRYYAKQLAYLIRDHCPDSRERSLAFTELENAIFWANASIARNE